LPFDLPQRRWDLANKNRNSHPFHRICSGARCRRTPINCTEDRPGCTRQVWRWQPA